MKTASYKTTHLFGIDVRGRLAAFRKLRSMWKGKRGQTIARDILRARQEWD
jgi:hypothetical protein